MIRNYEDYKPVKTGGQIFVFLGFIILVYDFFLFNDPELNHFFHIFAWINICYYLLMGFGLIQKKIWGYYLLKTYLYLLAIGFPIGTYIGLKSLKYLKEKNIEDFFVKQTIEL